MKYDAYGDDNLAAREAEFLSPIIEDARSAASIEFVTAIDSASQCDSPIEGLFLAAYVMHLHRVERTTPYFSPTWQIHVGVDALSEHSIDSPTIGIIECRVDFAFRRTAGLLDTEQLVSDLVIVECDGHDFHERTKEQAARDKKRDRELQGAGFNVIRFTGSEIFRSPLLVAVQVYDFLNASIERKRAPREAIFG